MATEKIRIRQRDETDCGNDWRGSAGLAAARHFLDQGFEITGLRTEDDLGGAWNSGKPWFPRLSLDAYHFFKPGTDSPIFPMPRGYPDYPHHAQILALSPRLGKTFSSCWSATFPPALPAEPTHENDARTQWYVTF